MSQKPAINVKIVRVTCPEEKQSLHWQKNKKFEVYCTIEVQKEKKKTKKVASSQDQLDPPHWNESFTFPINPKKLSSAGADIEILVHHKERLLGHIQIPVNDLSDGIPLDSFYPLQTRKEAQLQVIATRKGLDSILGVPQKKENNQHDENKEESWSSTVVIKSTPSSKGSSSNIQRASQSDTPQGSSLSDLRRQKYADLPQGWDIALDPKGQVYFLNHSTKTTTYTDPRIQSQSLNQSQQSQSLNQSQQSQSLNQSQQSQSLNQSQQSQSLSQSQLTGDSKVCAGCNIRITTAGLNALNRTWHRDCFNCDFCKKSLVSSGNFTSKYDRPFCHECQTILWGTYCAKCNRVITVQALKSGNQLFHPQCLQ